MRGMVDCDIPENAVLRPHKHIITKVGKYCFGSMVGCGSVKVGNIRRILLS